MDSVQLPFVHPHNPDSRITFLDVHLEQYHKTHVVTVNSCYSRIYGAVGVTTSETAFPTPRLTVISEKIRDKAFNSQRTIVRVYKHNCNIYNS